MNLTNDMQVIKLLKAKGYKHTPQRSAIIEILVAEEYPLSAKDIVERMEKNFPGLSPDTVYRNLKVLSNLGIVNRIQQQGKQGTKFELDGKPHHHHLVCIACGKSVCLPYCPIEDECERLAAQADFKLVSHTFEIHGYCQACQKNKEVSNVR